MLWKTRHAGMYLVRIGFAFAFCYAAIAGFITPDNWVGWIPGFAQDLSPFGAEGTLMLFGVGEIVLALWLITGVREAVALTVSGALFLGIALMNLGAMDIVFRDIALGFAAFGTAIMSRRDAAAKTSS